MRPGCCGTGRRGREICERGRQVDGDAEFNFVKLQIGTVPVVGRAGELVVLVCRVVCETIGTDFADGPIGFARTGIKLRPTAVFARQGTRNRPCVGRALII